MNINFDQKADVLYIQFQKGKSKKTLKLKEGILVDVDKKGRLFGIEILDMSQRMPLNELRKVNISLPLSS